MQHMVMVRMIPGTATNTVDKKGMVIKTTETYHLNCTCRWSRTYVSLTEAGAYKLAEAHENQ